MLMVMAIRGADLVVWVFLLLCLLLRAMLILVILLHFLVDLNLLLDLLPLLEMLRSVRVLGGGGCSNILLVVSLTLLQADKPVPPPAPREGQLANQPNRFSKDPQISNGPGGDVKPHGP